MNRVLSCLGILLLASCPCASAEQWQSQFANPPMSARPHTWWHWMHGNVTKDGITADLEAMKRVGLGGFQAFHISTQMPPGPVPYMSSEWRDHMAYAVREADRLGLEVCLHNCAGWSSSGGPWVTPDHSMFEIVTTERRVAGPAAETYIRRPPARLGYYRDIAVLAFPTPAAELDGHRGFRIDQARGKAGFDRLDDPQPDGRTAPADAIVPFDSIIDLTSRLREDGSLDWRIPNGEWTIIRFGYTPTMRTNHPAPDEGRGLECDKLSAAGADQHWQGMVQKVLDDIGPLAGQTLYSVLIDSYETGQQNWTHDFAAEFSKRRGYELRKYLPTITGRVVQSVDVTERFLWDFRRTIGDLFCENYFGRFAQLCHDRNLKLSIEPYGGWTGNFHDLEVAREADIPMGEFWATRQNDWCEWSVKLAASAAHTQGRTLVGAESFTSAPSEANWTLPPDRLKAQGDHYFAAGLNRMIFHSYAHQPWPSTVQPGMTMSEYGMQLNRNNTWFNEAGAWMDYLARCQYVLQQGRFVADLCYLWNDSAPNRMRRRDELRPLPPNGYDYDAATTRDLMAMEVQDGVLTLPSGMSYRVLVLPQGDAMRPETLRKIKQLADAGATIVGPRPTRSPSLQAYPQCDEDVLQLSESLWGEGRIAASGEPLAETLNRLGVLPDFDLADPAERTPFEYIHRRTEDAEVYFVTNQWKRNVQAECVFRVDGEQPELWRPTTGEQRPAPLWRSSPDGRTIVSLQLKPAESVFVVFSRQTAPDLHAAAANGPAGQLQAKLWLPHISIKRAIYGVLDGLAEQQVDVTQAVQQLVDQGVHQIQASNALGSDPAFGVVKQLQVDYDIDGTEYRQVVPELSDLMLHTTAPNEPSPPMSELIVRGNQLELRSFTPGDYDVLLPNGSRIEQTVEMTPPPIVIEGPWTVQLTPPQARQASDNDRHIVLERLASLSENADEDVRYFAGTATYRTVFEMPADQIGPGKAHWLNLGRVEAMARVELNGQPLGTLWNAPFDVDVTDAVRAGENELVVHVATQWPNRLIGEERRAGATSTKRYLRDTEFPQEVASATESSPAITYSVWRHWLASDDLLPAGLIGPVTIYPGVCIPLGPETPGS
ncbi:MAG: hypothetical protein KDA44_10750 [Planctomycetales bacterium]|nr:hypothetical protein [Planctomycetales bacterium]